MKSILMLFLAVGLLAADVTGTWTGNIEVPAGGGEEAHTSTAHLVLTQSGNKITGSAGPNADSQHDIQNGTAEGGKIKFEVMTGDATMKFELNESGDELKGSIRREKDGETREGKIAVKRQPK